MSHTNSTTNYSLPQFITTDKPAWLTDINNAFLAIDNGMDAAKDAADNAQGDATQALSDAGDALTAAGVADAKGAGAVASIEATFDPTTVYAVGTKVMYNNLLYRCTVAVTTPGPWTGIANWERVTAVGLIPTNAGELPVSSTLPNVTTLATIENLQQDKAEKPTEHSTTSGAVTIQFPTIGNSALVIINRGFNAYDGCFLLLTGTNNNTAQIIELYKGSAISTLYKAPNGLGFTIGSDEMDNSSISIVPIKGSFSVSG